MKKIFLLISVTILASTLLCHGQVSSLNDKWNLFTLDLKDGLPPWLFERGNITINIKNGKVMSKGLGFKTVGKAVEMENTVTFSNLKTKVKVCNNPEGYKVGSYGNNRKKIEPIFLNLLEEVNYFRVNGDRLYLLIGDKEIASFEKYKPTGKSIWTGK